MCRTKGFTGPGAGEVERERGGREGIVVGVFSSCLLLAGFAYLAVPNWYSTFVP